MHDLGFTPSFNPQQFYHGPHAQFMTEQPSKQKIEKAISSRIKPDSDLDDDNDIQEIIREENKFSVNDVEYGLPEDMDEAAR